MFTGTVQSTSHEGGLMVAFDGSSPSLNAIIVLSDDGTYVGKVDGVIGSTEHPLAHVAHIDRSLNLDDLMGRTVTIRPKKKREERGRDRQRSDRRSRDDDGRQSSRDDRQQDRRQRYDRNGGDRRGQDRGRGRQNTYENNDWDCPACNNSNFARRTVCNRCEAPRPGGGQGTRQQPRFNDRSSRGRGGRDGRRERRNDRSGTFNDNDWDCPACNNSNFSFRQSCNRCDAPRPGGRSNNSRPQGDRNRRGDSRGRGDRFAGGRRDDRNGGRSYGGQQRNGGRSYGARGDERQGRNAGDRQSRGDRDNRSGERRDVNRRPQQQRSEGQGYRRARGKRPGHAHNREPRDFRDGPRRFRRSDDD